MAPTKILLDSNTYFRLARSLHPLLESEFGTGTRYCLHAIDDLDKEFRRSLRLQQRFAWVNETEYQENRAGKLHLKPDQRKAIKQASDFMLDHARSEGLGTSRVDATAVATAFVLAVQIVSDDRDLLRLAEDFEVATLTTLQLMRLMLDENHIDMAQVRQICEYWQYQKDLPADFRREYRQHFGEEPPPPL